jgi:Leucine-rich repeat (LRR) protein
VADLSPLAGLRSLKTLRLADNQVASLAPLLGMKLLRTLTIKTNPRLGRSEAGDLRRALPGLNIDFLER